VLVDMVGFEEAEKIVGDDTVPAPGTNPLESNWGTSAVAQRQIQEIMALVPPAAPVT
jgi:hypothetical protein